MGILKAICISPERGTVKQPVVQAEFRAGHGIVGDAHAGDWHRQVSLLPAESIDKVRALIPALADGAFAENLVISGVSLAGVTVGTRLSVGPAVLEVSQIGKKCHQGCEIQRITGDCIMPREGVFCRVLTGGQVAVGAEVVLLPAAAVAGGES